MPHNKAHLSRRQPGVNGHQHTTGERHRELAEQSLVAVGREHTDTVPGSEPIGAQSLCEAGRIGAEASETNAARPIDAGQHIRMDIGAAF